MFVMSLGFDVSSVSLSRVVSIAQLHFFSLITIVIPCLLLSDFPDFCWFDLLLLFSGLGEFCFPDFSCFTSFLGDFLNTMDIIVKGPQKWTFFETCLLHVFYQFLTADYEYNIFRMLKKCYDDFLEG